MEPKTTSTNEDKKGKTPFEYPIVGKSKAVDTLIKQIGDIALQNDSDFQSRWKETINGTKF